MLLELVRDLLLERHARIEHDSQQADHLELAIEVGVYALDRVDQIRQTLEREVLALHGDHHAVGRAQAVERKHRQRGRAVDEDEVVVRLNGGQGVLEAMFALLEVHQLDLGASQLAVGGQHVVGAGLGACPRLCDVGGTDQYLIDRARQRALVHAAAHGRVALGIQVHQQHPLRVGRQSGGEVDRRGGLADAAFLVGDAEDAGHELRKVSKQGARPTPRGAQYRRRARAAPSATRG